MRRWASPLPWLLLAAACRAEAPPQPPTPSVVHHEPVVVVPEPAAAPVVRVVPEPVAAPVEVPWGAGDLPRILKVQALVHAAAERHGVDPRVLNAIIWHESRFNAAARGPGGAAGLMQLMPTTSKGLAKRLKRASKPFDPAFNVEAGALLVSRLLTIFDGDLELALAGYALGHVAVQRRVESGEALPDRTLRFIDHVETWLPAFATLPCPHGASAHSVEAPREHAPGPLCADAPTRTATRPKAPSSS